MGGDAYRAAAAAAGTAAAAGAGGAVAATEPISSFFTSYSSPHPSIEQQ